MKHGIIFFLLLFCVFLPDFANAQIFNNSKERSNFRWNFFPVFLGRLSGQYEYAGKRLSANLNGNLSFAGQKTGYLVGSNFRYFLSEKRTSLFIGGVANYSDYSEVINFTNKDGLGESSTARGKALLLTLNGGVKVNILRIFNFHARIGYAPPFVLDFETASNNITQNDFDFYRNSFSLKSAFDGEVSFGIRF